MLFINNNCSMCKKLDLYKIGFTDGKKEGLKEANIIIEELIEELKETLKRLSSNEEDIL